MNNVAPVIQPLLLGQSNIEENEDVALFVAFDDLGKEVHTVTVDWGDGHVETLTVPATAFSVSPVHRYLTDGNYVIKATVRDREALSSVETATLTVTNHLPVAGPVGTAPGFMLFEGDTVTLSGAFSDLSINDDYTVTVNWGDGTSSEAVVDSVKKTYRATHRYDDDPAGFSDLYSVTVTISDGTDIDTVNTLIQVENIKPTMSLLPDLNAPAGLVGLRQSLLISVTKIHWT